MPTKEDALQKIKSLVERFDEQYGELQNAVVCRDAINRVSTGYDYSQAGIYFVMICCQNQEYLFF